MWMMVAATGGCTPVYQEPKLPKTQMALVEVEERATVESIGGKVPRERVDRATKASRSFWVAPTCHELHVRYEEEYVRLGGGAGLLMWSPATIVLTLGASVASVAANSKVSAYETETPIRFYVPARAGMRFWVTSTFTGDVFMPRIAVLNAAHERIGVILPEQPCTVAPSADVLRPKP
jgi:hypothetical protein